MNKISSQELKKIQLDMLAFIDQTCRQEQINYSLGGGSLLGAVRHGGFIPWDDDIDLVLPRADYERLLERFMQELPDEYGLIYYKSRPTYLPFAKLYDKRTYFTSKLDNLNRGTGVFIDLFPMDVLPGDATERAKFKKEVAKAAIDLTSSNPTGLDYASATKPIYFIGKVLLWGPRHLKNKGKARYCAEKVDLLMQSYREKDTPYVGYAYSGYSGECFDKAIFEAYEDVAFEELTVRKLVNHDSYLKALYGDYMTLPPEDERVNHSYYQWFWKDDEASEHIKKA
ncbi:LicD family protein [Lactococcus termiticola]|uniref:Lipopolysaccharide cholinephosphotransferase n=1 Tax=Lactococcus termiticola TaxID=2169526 RepID=A0A2R5HKD3_9LACT|nr:LicD family protein [Lactococcus termiticola]GBG97258.1 lipopolysaccharide cholinephosphotransferase [Lactococcus termiticola]